VGYGFVDRTMGKLLGLGLKLQLKIRVTYRVRVRVRHSFVHINICILFNTMYGPQIRVHILRVENSGKKYPHVGNPECHNEIFRQDKSSFTFATEQPTDDVQFVLVEKTRKRNSGQLKTTFHIVILVSNDVRTTYNTRKKGQVNANKLTVSSSVFSNTFNASLLTLRLHSR